MRRMIIELQPSCPFDLNLSLCCGQTFRWQRDGEWWRGVVGKSYVSVRQENYAIEFHGINKNLLMTYLGLTDDLLTIYSQINKDGHIREAIEQFRGLRILRQDPWECLISYICATYKNIPSIRRMLDDISKRYGERIEVEGQHFFTFPSPQKLAKASLGDLKECGLGYRAKYVLGTAVEIFQGSLDLDDLKDMRYEDAHAFLQRYPGVGPKVADCVLLFGLGRSEAFPVDVWIKRAIIRHYASHFPEEFLRRISKEESVSDSRYRQLNRFGREYFGRYAGYAQEYLYHRERMNSQRSTCRV